MSPSRSQHLLLLVQDTSASGGKGGKPMASSQGLAADRSKLFNGKQLVTSAKSAYQLCWPILLWGVLVLLMYGISYNTLTHEQDTLMYIKLTQKARVAASRVTYFALQLSLDPVSAPTAFLVGVDVCLYLNGSKRYKYPAASIGATAPGCRP